MPPLVLFDDAPDELAPLCDLRPTFEIATGALPTRQRLEMTLGARAAALFVRAELLELAGARPGAAALNRLPTLPGPFLIVSGRCALPPTALTSLAPGQFLVEDQTGDVVACLLDAPAAGAFLNAGDAGSRRAPTGSRVLPYPALVSRPWHVRTFRDACLAADVSLMGARAPTGQDLEGRADLVTFGPHPLLCAPSAKVYPGVVLDREGGPIVIDDHAVVRPGATIIGPAYVGPRSTVLDRALVKGNTALGPYVKVAGEVGGTIFQGYANKAHDGHLGDSWIGEWVNLGAGTTNSNLLNTYAEVAARATPAGRTERTGQQFLGCVLGDHVKTAIGTRIMTGAVVHTGAMLARTEPVAGCVPAFAWLTDAPRPEAQPAPRFRLDKFLDVARAAMGRRSVPLGEAYARRLAALHAAG